MRTRVVCVAGLFTLVAFTLLLPVVALLIYGCCVTPVYGCLCGLIAVAIPLLPHAHCSRDYDLQTVYLHTLFPLYVVIALLRLFDLRSRFTFVTLRLRFDLFTFDLRLLLRSIYGLVVTICSRVCVDFGSFDFAARLRCFTTFAFTRFAVTHRLNTFAFTFVDLRLIAVYGLRLVTFTLLGLFPLLFSLLRCLICCSYVDLPLVTLGTLLFTLLVVVVTLATFDYVVVIAVICPLPR